MTYRHNNMSLEFMAKHIVDRFNLVGTDIALEPTINHSHKRSVVIIEKTRQHDKKKNGH